MAVRLRVIVCFVNVKDLHVRNKLRERKKKKNN